MLKLIHAYNMKFSSVKNYYDSFSDKESDLNSFAISCVSLGADGYFDWLYTYEKNMYYLVDEAKPDYIIGYGSFSDHKVLDYHKKHLNAGAIGYGIRPVERNKGYGTELLHLLLLKCEESGMKEVCVSCLKENVYSKQIILNNNGLLEKEFYDEDSLKVGLKFWIKLQPLFSDKTKKMVNRYKE